VADRRIVFILLALFSFTILLTPITSLEGPVHSATAQVIPTALGFIELGYSPGSLSSLQEGIPIYSPGDEMWLLSTSNQAVAVQLISPKGGVASSHQISTSTVSLLYIFSASDAEGSWTLDVTLKNTSMISLKISFLNPSAHPILPVLDNFSLQASNLNLGFMIPENTAFNFQACLASSELNSTLAVPIPQAVGGGEMLVGANLHNATLNINGFVNRTFSFWYDMDYLYTFDGNLNGEFLSRDITAISSSTALFTSSSSEKVSLTNNTVPRPGRYELNAFFESDAGLIVEQTAALLLTDGAWLWTGGCNQILISSLFFSENSSLNRGPQTWPTALYLMYEIGGVDSYSRLQMNLNQTRVDILSSIGGVVVKSARPDISYLNFTVANNPNILSSEMYNDSLYMVGRNFPLSVQLTPVFGSQNLQPLTVSIDKPFTVNDVYVPLGMLSIHVTSNSVPLANVSVVADNGYGGRATATSDSDGNVLIYVPSGLYNVTASIEGVSMSKSTFVSTTAESNLVFIFPVNGSAGYLQYLLVSILVVGLILNIWLWILQPKRKVY